MPAFELIPRKVPAVRTKYRQIVTEIPVPESIRILENLRRYEPLSMSGQPPVLWDRAEGIQVHDRWGNTWLDWSSGVVVTNAGHGHPRIRQAILDQVEHGLIHNYCFPSEIRGRLTECLAGVAPEGLKKVFLLTTGARGLRMRGQAGADLGTQARRGPQDHHRDLPKRLPRPHPRGPNGRRHSGPQGVDRQLRQGLRPGALPRRLPRAGHHVSKAS